MLFRIVMNQMLQRSREACFLPGKADGFHGAGATVSCNTHTHTHTQPVIGAVEGILHIEMYCTGQRFPLLSTGVIVAVIG